MYNSDLLSVAGRDTTLRRVATTNGGEYAGPCPFCAGHGAAAGTDRFRVWPNHPSGGGRWWCRRCGRSGDTIAYLVEAGELTLREAAKARRSARSPAFLAANPTARRSPGMPCDVEPLMPLVPPPAAPPDPGWQAAASTFVDRCAAALWSPEGERAMAWLRARGLSGDTIYAAGLGYHPHPEDANAHTWATWGEHRVRLYRGIVIPWWADGALWRVNIRRPAGSPKYYSPGGCANGLYNADLLRGAGTAVVVEGELDALLLLQHAGDLATAVALGSTTGARRRRWIDALGACETVLVALDADTDRGKGDRAAAWWLNALMNARRWRPWWGDAGEMHEAGANLRAWIGEELEVEVGEMQPAAGERIRRRLQAAETRAFVGQLVALGIPCEGYADWAAYLAEMEGEMGLDTGE